MCIVLTHPILVSWADESWPCVGRLGKCLFFYEVKRGIDNPAAFSVSWNSENSILAFQPCLVKEFREGLGEHSEGRIGTG